MNFMALSKSAVRMLSEWCVPYLLMCAMASSRFLTTLTPMIRSKVFGVPVLLCCRFNVRNDFSGFFVASDFHAVLAQLSNHSGQVSFGDFAVNQQFLCGVACSRALTFSVYHNGRCFFEVGVFFNVNVAVARSRLDNWNTRCLYYCFD